MTVQNAFEDLALEHSNQFGDAHYISGNKKKWRREFNDPITTWWDKYENGITMPDPVGGNFVVTMGTTPNAEGWIVSKESFNFPLRAAALVTLSQKIANNEIYLELVGIDPVTGALDETRIAAWRLAGSDSVTTTIARSEVRNGGAARLQSANLTVTSLTTGTCILEITAESDEVWFSSKAANSVAARSVADVKNSIAPDPAREYKLRMRFKNGAVAPASSTTVTVGFGLVVDYSEILAEITGGNGNNAAGQTIPVTQIGTVTVATGTAGVLLGASATVVGTSASKVLSAATTNPTLIKATAGRIYGYQLANLHATQWRYLRVYNKATAPTVGTDVPVMVVPIPPNGMVDIFMDIPFSLATGIGYAITGAVADNDATAIGANEIVGSIIYL